MAPNVLDCGDDPGAPRCGFCRACRAQAEVDRAQARLEQHMRQPLGADTTFAAAPKHPLPPFALRPARKPSAEERRRRVDALLAGLGIRPRG